MSNELMGSDLSDNNDVISILFLAISVSNHGLTVVCDGREPPPDPAPGMKFKINTSFM